MANYCTNTLKVVGTKKDIDNFEMIEYENYQEKQLFIESETFKHYEMLKAHLKVDGIIIEIEDAYRSLEKQENIFLEHMKKYGLEYTSNIVAMPGTSEHHTGQAIDIIVQKNGKWITENNDLLEETKIFDKIHKNLKYFGFILRYPKGKEFVTGYSYEPWHIRYVGEEISMNIGDDTLEEYLEKNKATKK